MDAAFAIHTPVVVAVVVHSAPAVKEEAVLACLQGEGSVLALVELVAVFRVGIGLETVRLGARGNVAVRRHR